jgi:RNA polymerase sigma-70 factor (ECF subfamily)
LRTLRGKGRIDNAKPKEDVPMIRLELTFTGERQPALNKTTFRHPLLDKEGNEQNAVRGRDEGAHPTDYGSFPWSRAVQALAVLLLRWAAWARRPRRNGAAREPDFAGGRGSLAASLNFALSKKNDWLCEMFGYDARGEPLLLRFIKRSNPDLKRPDEPVGLALHRDRLPPEQIYIYLDGEPCEDAARIEVLAQAIEEQWHSTAAPPAPTTDGPSPDAGRVHAGTAVGLKVRLKLDRDFDAYLHSPEEKKRLMHKIWEELNCPSAREVSIRKGCVELVLELTPEEAERLLWAAKAGTLDEFGLIDVERVDEGPAPSGIGPNAVEEDEGEASPFASSASPAGRGVTSDAGGHALPRAASPALSTSASLLEEVRQHDPEGWTRLVQLYSPLVYWWCRRKGLASSDVEDVVQEVFVTVMRRITQFQIGRDRPGSFRAWLRTITWVRVADHLRRERQTPAAVGGERLEWVEEAMAYPRRVERPEPDDVEERQLLLYRVLELVRPEFAEDTWQAFLHTTLEDRKAADVARDLGMSVNSVFSARSRVLRRLRQLLAEYVI